MANTTGLFLSASRVGDPALDWGGRALCAESERGPALKSVPISRSLSRLAVFPPQSRVAPLGITCSTLLAGMDLSAPSPEPQARKDA